MYVVCHSTWLLSDLFPTSFTGRLNARHHLSNSRNFDITSGFVAQEVVIPGGTLTEPEDNCPM